MGSIGAFALIIMAAEWIGNGGSLLGMPRQLGLVLTWCSLIFVQLLTLYGLRRRLRALGQSFQWVWLIVVLWVLFDAALIAHRRTYSFLLAVLYIASQALLLFDLRSKAGSKEG